MTDFIRPADLDPDFNDPDSEVSKLRDHLLAGGSFAGWKGVDEVTLAGMSVLAKYFYDHEDYDQAATLYASLCFLDSSERKHFFGLGATRKMQGRYKDAADALGVAVALDIQDPVASYYTADCLLNLGQRDDAQGLLEMCIQFSGAPEHAEIRKSAKALLGLLTTHNKAPGQAPGAR